MQPNSATRVHRPLGTGAFLALQGLLIAAGVCWGSYRVVQQNDERALPQMRNEPLTVRPTYDYPVVISDEQLVRVLRKLAPRFNGDKTKINYVDHGLRFWDVQAKFKDPNLFSGEAMRELLMDNRRFVQVYGPKVKPLLIDYGSGVRVRVQEGLQSSSHVDHTMACLAEVGTPLAHPLITPTRAVTFRAMVDQALRDFSLNQLEYEWSALTFALFIPPTQSWLTSEGQEITFDRLADRLMRQDVPQGVCFGHHRMHALVMFLRIDEQTPIISPTTRAKIMTYLHGMTETLVRTQSPDGYWDGDWPQPASGAKPDHSSGDVLMDRILSTGHAMEWWSLAPEELHPPRSVLASGGQWLVRTIDNLSDTQTQEYYTFLTHAGHALSLWRGKLPYEVPIGL